MSLISFSRDKFIPSDEVSLNVRGNYLSVTRGYQVFTFFKTTNNGIPVFLEDHVDRIVGNAQALKMNLSFSKQDIKTLVHQTLEKNDLSNTDCNVMIIFAGKSPDDISGLVSSQEVDLFIVTSPIKKYPQESYQNGISLGLYEFERIDAQAILKDEILNRISTLSMFSEKKLIVIDSLLTKIQSEEKSGEWDGFLNNIQLMVP